MTVPLVLASQSPARLSTLRAAGVQPRVIVSTVDEDALLAEATAAAAQQMAAGLGVALELAEHPQLLARAKAEDVVDRHDPDALVLGCDSMLEFDGTIVGKPHDPQVARERWRAMRGQRGVLHTGHAIIDNRHDRRGAGGGATYAGATSSTVVYFADLSNEEIDAYVATGEPLAVAGGFTVDGLGGPYVERIEGDYHGVVGVSLPLLRALLRDLGVDFHHLRSAAAS
jgi:septum formation protein